MSAASYRAHVSIGRMRIWRKNYHRLAYCCGESAGEEDLLSFRSDLVRAFLLIGTSESSDGINRSVIRNESLDEIHRDEAIVRSRFANHAGRCLRRRRRGGSLAKDQAGDDDSLETIAFCLEREQTESRSPEIKLRVAVTGAGTGFPLTLRDTN